mgnify:FL=1
MNKYVLLLLVIVVYILSSKKYVYEGFEDGEEEVKEEVKEEVEEEEENCDYRKRVNYGTMCKEKWGEPECRTWTKNEKVKTIKDGPTLKVLKGYYSNDFMYELDYENYDTQLIEGEEGKKEEEGENIPRGIHSSFFA